MEYIKYLGVGLLFFLAFGILIICGYVAGNVLCEPIVRKLNMHVSKYRLYSDLKEEEKESIDYLGIVLGVVLNWTLVTLVLSVLLIAAGSMVSEKLGL